MSVFSLCFSPRSHPFSILVPILFRTSFSSDASNGLLNASDGLSDASEEICSFLSFS